jgi:hypothetical protein
LQGYVNIANKFTARVVFGLLIVVNVVLAVAGCYAALIGNWLPEFRDILFFPSVLLIDIHKYYTIFSLIQLNSLLLTSIIGAPYFGVFKQPSSGRLLDE